MHVDLGCAGKFRGDVNIDINRYPDAPGMLVCNLGFERIPLDDNVADKVSAHCFIEHVPFYIYLSKEGEKYSPMKHLFAEVARILKPGGIFLIEVPQTPSFPVWMDPGHMSFWTKHTAPYLQGQQVWNGKAMGELILTQNKELDLVFLEIIYTKK